MIPTRKTYGPPAGKPSQLEALKQLVENEKSLDKSDKQTTFFDDSEDWKAEWKGMPEFVRESQEPYRTLLCHFKCEEDVAKFATLVGAKITADTRWLWWPKIDIKHVANLRYVNNSKKNLSNPKYPVYIPSKGRWESRHTVRELERLGVPYKICVERQEYDNYAAVIDPEKILVVPHSNVPDGLVRSRNWIWNHARDAGHARHWQLDDNITYFWRNNNNIRIRVSDGTIFRCLEDFTERYECVPHAGMNYYMFAPDRAKCPPYYLNTRVYSIHLLDNKFELDGRPLYFRGPYNDDTDLSLRILKAGWPTILFNAFLGQKKTTMTVKGGNVPIYVGDGRLKMAEMLRDWHPDVTTITQKWGRYQHQVDYSPFKRNRLVRKAGWDYSGLDEYGMELIELQ